MTDKETLARLLQQVNAAGEDVTMARRRGEALTIVFHIDKMGNVLPCKVTRVLHEESRKERQLA